MTARAPAPALTPRPVHGLALFVALVLALFLAPPDAARAGLIPLGDDGAAAAPDLPTGAELPSDWMDALTAEGHEITDAERYFALPALPPPTCDGTQGVTHALLVGADVPSNIAAHALRGPKNDVEILASSLATRGVDAAHIAVLVDGDATWDGLERAAQEALARAACGDSLILSLSGHTLDWPQGRANWFLLNQPEGGVVSVLSAEAVGRLVVAFRNRGVDVTVMLDGMWAEGFALEDRQAGLTGASEGAESRYLLRERPARPAPPREIVAPGALTVFYSAEVDGVSPELLLPRDMPDSKHYGLMSFFMAVAFVEAEVTTPPAMIRSLRQNSNLSAITDAERDYNFVVVTTDQDMRILAEEATGERGGGDGAPQDGGGTGAEVIRILSPELTRDARPLPSSEIEIRGEVISPQDVLMVLVNGAEAAFDAGGAFRAPIELQAGVNAVQVLAVTRSGAPIRLSFELYYEGDVQALLGEGQRLALLIANQDYAEGSGLTTLKTPIGDAEALAGALARFGYVTETVSADGAPLNLFLKNPSKLEIETALYELGRIAGEKDTVLIFYAGHGNFEASTGKASWMAADARADRPFTWLSSDAISDAILRMDAGSVLLISDSCYSGALLRGAPDLPEIADKDRLLQLQRTAAKRSRILMSSGANEPVLDGGGGLHSVFAAALLAGLEQMEEDAFTAGELFAAQVMPKVLSRAVQEPQFRPIEKSGHEGGDVVLVRLGG